MLVKECKVKIVLKPVPRVYIFSLTSCFPRLSPTLFDLHSQFSWVTPQWGFLFSSAGGNLRPTEAVTVPISSRNSKTRISAVKQLVS